ncbi:MAG: PIN domain-containing protein, partial [Proteobacteria bacterium]|nr:PIN domain-containing protein [Pseudomonadota bacterium]
MKRVPKLLVMFDTSVLYTQLASDLLQKSAKKVIEENSDHIDLIIEWYVPDIVIGERRYQMISKAKELLPSMQKMETLLGHRFGIGDDTLEMHVDKAIGDNLKELNLKGAPIKVADVDWNEIIDRSVKRKPPFEENENEKGFRDSIIAQSFIQLHKVSPTTPSICKLVFVSNDQRLNEYVGELTKREKNVRIVNGLSDLESLINTIVSEIPEELAEK